MRSVGSIGLAAPSGTVECALYDLLSALSNPKATKARLDQLAQAREEADEAIAKLGDVEAAAAKLHGERDALDKREQETAAKEAKVATDFQAIQARARAVAGLEDRWAEMTAREDAVAKAEGEIGERRERIEAANRALRG